MSKVLFLDKVEILTKMKRAYENKFTYPHKYDLGWFILFCAGKFANVC